LLPPTFEHFSGNNNYNYFINQHRGNMGGAYLVGKSVFKLNNLSSELDPTEVEMHLDIAALICTMTRGQRDRFAAILNNVANVAISHHCSTNRSTNEWATVIPRTPALIRSLYVEGKDALLPNVPRPQVTIVDDHAYVSLQDCVADLLGHGFELDSIEAGCQQPGAVSNINETAVARRIQNNAVKAHPLSENVLCLYLTEWSDGFEPSSSKNNRGSCWLKSVTISPPPSKIHSLSHTYPIALGLEDQSHGKVEEMFAEELKMFREGQSVTFYHGGKRHNVIMYLELFASLQDQPERRSANYIMLGTSNFTAHWGQR
jgi:hypothetical protein